jgi:hypothetical protein
MTRGRWRKASVLFSLRKLATYFLDDLLATGTGQADFDEPVADGRRSIAGGFGALALRGLLLLNVVLPSGGFTPSYHFVDADGVVPGPKLVIGRRFESKEQMAEVGFAEFEAGGDPANGHVLVVDGGDSAGAVKIVKRKPICLQLGDQRLNFGLRECLFSGRCSINSS